MPELVFGNFIRDDKSCYAVGFGDLGKALQGLCGGESRTGVGVVFNGFAKLCIAVQRFVLRKDFYIVFYHVFGDQGRVLCTHHGIGAKLLTVQHPRAEFAVFFLRHKGSQLFRQFIAGFQADGGGTERSAGRIQRQGIELIPFGVDRGVGIDGNRGYGIPRKVGFGVPATKLIPVTGRNRERVGGAFVYLHYGCVASVVCVHRQVELLGRLLAGGKQPAKKNQNTSQQENLFSFHDFLCFYDPQIIGFGI